MHLYFVNMVTIFSTVDMNKRLYHIEVSTVESQCTNDLSCNTFDMNKLLFSTDISFEEHFCDYKCGIVADIVSFVTIYGTNIYLD